MQQINLYVAELRPRRIILPARQIGMLLGAVLVLLVAGQSYLGWQAGESAAAVQQAEARLAELQTRYEALEAQVSQMRVDENLLAENERLTQRMDNTRSLMKSLQPGGSADMTAQISGLLEGLARQHQSGLWLTGVGILASGQSLQLRGVVTKPELLPMYLQRLRAESSFAGRQFNVLQLQAPEDRKSNLNFFISTKEIEQEASR